MKKAVLLYFLTFITFQNINAQNTDTSTTLTQSEKDQFLNQLDTIAFLKEAADSACKCIDSIKLSDRSPEEVSTDIKKCIDNRVVVYESSMMILASLKNSHLRDTISINMDTNANNYKQYYYDIERRLRDSCSSLKNALSSNNKEGEHSMSVNPEAMEQYNKGVALVSNEKEEYAAALPYFKKAVEIDPQFAFAWDNLGLCYRKVNDYDKALLAYQKSLEIDPKGEVPLENIPVVYEYKKEYDKEMEAYQSLLKSDPDNPEAYYGIGRVYFFHKNDLEKGLDNMCKAYDLYIKANSPYRVDAEKIINEIYVEMKKADQEDKFNQILKDNNITPNKN